MLLHILLAAGCIAAVTGDSNILTGANDVIVARGLDGDLYSTPFSVQFGKKDIWLPRSGHVVSMRVNGEMVPLSMTLNSVGHAYFDTRKVVQSNYRFWSALLGMADPSPNQMTDTASADQLEKLPLNNGINNIEYQVTTSSGSIVKTSGNVYLVNSTQKFVISDIDGTITRSNVRGMVLPVLGLSDWKHNGVVKLYSLISEQGYMLIYLSSRAIGQSDNTRDYIYSLREGNYTMPRGPIFLRVDSIFNAFATEVIDGNPEVQKISKLARVRGLFPGNPHYAAYGNKETDITAYKALNIQTQRIYKLDEDSLITTVSSGDVSNFTQHTELVQDNYPNY